MSNVKPGDRALVVRASQPENVMKIVLVLGVYQPGSPLPTSLGRAVFPGVGPHWLCESLGAPFTVRANNAAGERRLGLAPVGVFPDANLVRLDPPEEEQTDDSWGSSVTVKDSSDALEGQS